MSKVQVYGCRVLVDYIQQGVEYATNELAMVQANKVHAKMYPDTPVPYPEICNYECSKS